MTKQYKPFDLAAAKAGAKLITRDGRAVTDIHHFESDKSNLPVAFHVEGDFGARWGRVDGRYSCGDTVYDLFMAPVERTVYVNIYPDRVAYWADSVATANLNAASGAIAVAVPITITITE